jgi:hypothetical protein
MFNTFGQGKCYPSECQNYFHAIGGPSPNSEKAPAPKLKKAAIPKLKFDFNLCFGNGFGSCEEFDGDDNCDLGLICKESFSGPSCFPQECN